jgi:hypothetical protein
LNLEPIIEEDERQYQPEIRGRIASDFRQKFANKLLKRPDHQKKPKLARLVNFMTNAKLWYLLIGLSAILYYLEREYETFVGFYLLPLWWISYLVAYIDSAVSNSAYYADLLMNP